MTVPHLNQQHARVLREIFEHPVARNLEWPDVLSLMEHLGNVQQRHDGKYQIQIGTAQTIVERPQHKDVELTELLRLRTFLKEAGLEVTRAQPAPGQSDTRSGSRAVVAVDHHQARFFEFGSDGVHLVERDHLEPLDPHGFERHLEHRKEADYKGERVPEPDEYYERMAQQLKGAGTILLVGDATGKSSAVRYLAHHLQEKHGDIWHHVVGMENLDLSSMTLPRLQELNERYKQTS